MRTPFARHYGCQYTIPDQPGIQCQETYLVDNFSEDLVLIINAQLLVVNDFIFEDKQHDRIISRTTAPDPITPGVQLSPHRLYIFPESRQDIRLLL
jgi:hypothetical protein